MNMKHEYAYCIGDAYLSEKFDTVKEALEELTRDFHEEDWEIYKDNVGQFILVDIVEVKDYEDLIHAHRIIEDLKEDACSEYERDDYLNDVDIEAFEKELNKFWKNYKEKNKIYTFYVSKSGTKKTYKLYIKEREYGYEFVSYELVGD